MCNEVNFSLTVSPFLVLIVSVEISSSEEKKMNRSDALLKREPRFQICVSRHNQEGFDSVQKIVDEQNYTDDVEIVSVKADPEEAYPPWMITPTGVVIGQVAIAGYFRLLRRLAS